MQKQQGAEDKQAIRDSLKPALVANIVSVWRPQIQLAYKLFLPAGLSICQSLEGR